MALALAARPDAEEPWPQPFARDVLEGLGRAQKSLPAKYFYDEAGSQLFDRICDLPEYYPTRTETGILRDAAGRIAARAGAGCSLVEFGSGSSTKVRILLDAMDAPAAYVPIDISAEHMRSAASALRADYPGLDVVPMAADFTRAVHLPADLPGRRVGFFPGSTIGNFTPPEAADFLRQAGETLGEASLLVLGVDLRKQVGRLEAAYNDAAGVTAAFNLNLLHRMNRELGGTFDVAAFRHRAFFNPVESRIEMHLESLADQTVEVAGQGVKFGAGETIHTENSYKYSVDDLEALAGRAGWKVQERFTDTDGLFAVFCLTRQD
jgi:dimethylhistidine N-methyltransferase